MLSPVVKKMLEVKLGKEIRYPSDIESLSYDIEKHTKQRISVNTLKRLFGLIEGVKEPRLYTLDIVACYLAFKNWDDITDHLSSGGNSEFSTPETIQVDSLGAGDVISFCYTPDRKVTIEYVSGAFFDVIESVNSKLQVGDRLIISHFVLHYPLLIDDVVRNGMNMGKFTAGKISGIMSLNLSRKNVVDY